MGQENDWIRTLVQGRSFADVGGLWGTENEKVTVAAQAGALDCAMVDMSDFDSVLWERFRERCRAEGVSNFRCIQADINDPETSDAIGLWDVVHCRGVLYHCPSPLQTVIRLSAVCARTLILGTAVIPPSITTPSGRLDSEPASALFVPGLNERQKTIVREHFQEVGASEMVGITTTCDWSLNDYAPWWWLFTREHVAALLKVAGFEILETSENWGGRLALYLAEKNQAAVAHQDVRQ